MEKYKDSDVELMSILLKLQEQTSPIRMSIGYTVGGTVRQGIILYEAAPKVIETLIEKGYTCVELGNVVRKFLQYDEGDRTKYAEEFAQKYLGKGQRTLYRYTKAYLEASAWADNGWSGCTGNKTH